MDKSLTNFVPDREATVEVWTSKAGAAHVVAWTTQQRATAIHEAGHAVIARLFGVPLKSVSIKERYGGRTETDEGSDERPGFTTWSDEVNAVTIALAGLAVTEVALGERMSGAHNDMREATLRLLVAMESGMDEGAPFLGQLHRYEQAPTGWVGNARTRRAERLLRELYGRAIELCEVHRDQIAAFAAILFERRRLVDDELERAFVEIGL